MIQPSRRVVLRAALVAAAAAAAPAAFAGPAIGFAAVAAPTRLRRREFRPHVRTTFLLDSGDAAYRGRLVGVRDQSTRTAGDDARFSLLFEIPDLPPEGIYAMRHAALRPFDLFLAPVGAKDSGRYEAVVNS